MKVFEPKKEIRAARKGLLASTVLRTMLLLN